ncbi:hypothetical protein F5Y15DRAFT_118404 [Xylariaceae sp. FL0016]|nr:hypothetical protein F5Y15DRAFT_118404 [Xylariaceae sp. FL0016]
MYGKTTTAESMTFCKYLPIMRFRCLRVRAISRRLRYSRSVEHSQRLLLCPVRLALQFEALEAGEEIRRDLGSTQVRPWYGLRLCGGVDPLLQLQISPPHARRDCDWFPIGPPKNVFLHHAWRRATVLLVSERGRKSRRNVTVPPYWSGPSNTDATSLAPRSREMRDIAMRLLPIERCLSLFGNVFCVVAGLSMFGDCPGVVVCVICSNRQYLPVYRRFKCW